MKKRRLKKKPIIILLLINVIIISLIIILPDRKVDNKTSKVSTLEKSKNDSVSEFKGQKYYIDSNLNRYLYYYKKNKDLSLDKVIALVNSSADKEKYKDTTKTDVSKGEVMLVNKYYYLTEDDTPSDLVTLTSKYNSGINSSMRKKAANAFMKMSDAASLDNVIIKNASAYRSYKYQVDLYNKYVKRDGKKAADTYSARPGFSEHQTGLATDINEIDNNFEDTDAFKWLDKNAYKYGFILRFPKDKEDITGYSYESWHYRYVGKNVAKKIKDEGLTLEEYYAYYVEKK